MRSSRPPLIYLYKTRPSKTAIQLVKSKAVKFKLPTKRQATWVLNYGATKPLENFSGTYLNHPTAVINASDKIRTFSILSDENIPTVPWTTDKEEALEWLKTKMVVARTLTRASEGRGAIFVESGGELPDAPLYTQYIKKQAEYRVNAAFGTIINIRQKRRRTDFEGEVNNLCRSHSNGWVFCSEGVDKTNPILSSLALASINAIGLDFGAVDIIYNAHYNSYYVLEVNSAPGMEGETLTNFLEALKNVFN
jgi:glutathione synthase/RimK-type ligase-like ATP-grasp enzyme